MRAPGRPIVSPITRCTVARRRTSHQTCGARAPRAMRIPISCVRCLTEYAVTADDQVPQRRAQPEQNKPLFTTRMIWVVNQQRELVEEHMSVRQIMPHVSPHLAVALLDRRVLLRRTYSPTWRFGGHAQNEARTCACTRGRQLRRVCAYACGPLARGASAESCPLSQLSPPMPAWHVRAGARARAARDVALHHHEIAGVVRAVASQHPVRFPQERDHLVLLALDPTAEAATNHGDGDTAGFYVSHARSGFGTVRASSRIMSPR
jgi:hypothetical protein